MAPRVTRSSQLLSFVDGLCFIDDVVIDLASSFLTELRAISATYGEEVVEKIVPHVIALMTKLNDAQKENSKHKLEIEKLNNNLTTAVGKCSDLNNSIKGKTLEYDQIEDQYATEISDLKSQLQVITCENRKLMEVVKDGSKLDLDRLIEESDEKFATLTAERKCLLTTVEVLEAEVRCLRAEIAQLEARARESQEYADRCTAAALSLATDQRQPPTPAADYTSDLEDQQDCHRSSDSGLSSPAPRTTRSVRSTTSTPQLNNDFEDVLLIGDSHLRHASRKCVYRGVNLQCIPGGKILDIKDRLVKFSGSNPSVILFHVGANNLKKGYRGGPGYNGGHGKKEALHSMADLLYTAKTKFKNSKIVLNSVLIRQDITYKALFDFNSQLELMCNNFDVTFVEANCSVGRRDLSRDGVHFNRRGVSRLSSLIENVIDITLRNLDASSFSAPDTSMAPSTSGLVVESEDVVLPAAPVAAGTSLESPPSISPDSSHLSGN